MLFILFYLKNADLEADVNDDDNDDNVIIIDESGWDHAVDQQQQQKSFRDWFWGFLFLLQFNVVLTISIIGIRNMIKQGYVMLYLIECNFLLFYFRECLLFNIYLTQTLKHGTLYFCNQKKHIKIRLDTLE